MVDFEIYIPSEYLSATRLFPGHVSDMFEILQNCPPPVAGLKWLPPPKKK